MSEYHSFVFHSADAESAEALRSHIFERYQFGGPQDTGTQITASAYGDAMSIGDAVRMALECGELDIYEQRELALELAECVNWDDCLRAFGEWDLAFLHGDLVPASVGRNAKRQDPEEGLGPKDEHAVGSEADETPNPTHPGSGEEE